MSILFRYVLREFLVPLSYCLTGFVGIYVLFELFGSFSRLMEAQLPMSLVVEYFAGYLSPYFAYLAPAALMLAALYTMWNFCRHSEITAMRASGVSFVTIARPILFVALLMALFVAWVNECYVPTHAQWAKQLRNERFRVDEVAKVECLVYRNSREFRTWSVAGASDAGGRHLHEVRLTQDRESGSRQWLLTAKAADYLDGEWWFTEPVIRHYGVNGDEIKSPTPELDALSFRVFPELRERPGDIMAQNRDWQYNNVRGKLRYLQTQKDLDAESRRDATYDAWAQIMSPWACLVITLFAIPAGIASGRQSVFKGILGALGMFFAFYGLVIFGMIASSREWLPPIVAAVYPHIVFIALGIRAFRKVR